MGVWARWEKKNPKRPHLLICVTLSIFVPNVWPASECAECYISINRRFEWLSEYWEALVCFWRALGGFLPGRQLYSSSAPRRQSWQMCCQSRRLWDLLKNSLYVKTSSPGLELHMESCGRASRENVSRGNILSLYHEGSRLSVDTFGVSACVPRNWRSFPLWCVCVRACVCLCASVHIHMSFPDSVRVCVALGLKSACSKLGLKPGGSFFGTDQGFPFPLTTNFSFFIVVLLLKVKCSTAAFIVIRVRRRHRVR